MGKISSLDQNEKDRQKLWFLNKDGNFKLYLTNLKLQLVKIKKQR